MKYTLILALFAILNVVFVNSLSVKGPTALLRCVVSGCLGEVCDDRNRISSCEASNIAHCYQTAECRRQDDGRCGWTQTTELTTCIKNSQN